MLPAVADQVGSAAYPGYLDALSDQLGHQPLRFGGASADNRHTFRYVVSASSKADDVARDSTAAATSPTFSMGASNPVPDRCSNSTEDLTQ